MIKKIDNEFVISVNTRLIFIEKLNYIKDIIDVISKSFDKKNNDIEDRFWNEIGDAVDLSKDDFEYHTEQLEILKEKYLNLPQIFFKSIIVSIYSVLETTINEVVQSIQNSIPKKIKFKDLRKKSSEIDDFLRFLDLIYDVELSELVIFKERLKQYADIRNNIVHFNGNVNRDNDGRMRRIKKFADINNDFSIAENGNIFIDNAKFIIDFNKFIEKFGLKIFDVIKITNH